MNAILEVKLTEPMTAPVPEVEGGFLSLKASGRILHLAANVNAAVVGPGIGRHRETGQLLREILTKLTVPMVVDADALNLLGGQLDIFRAVAGAGCFNATSRGSGLAFKNHHKRSGTKPR